MGADGHKTIRCEPCDTAFELAVKFCRENGVDGALVEPLTQQIQVNIDRHASLQTTTLQDTTTQLTNEPQPNNVDLLQ